MIINKPIIFLPIESTVRELDYKLNLTRYFCKKGFIVIIGNPPFIRDELKYKNYRAVFLEKGVNPDPNYYNELLNKGVYIYDLSDEGAANPVYSVNYQPAVETLKKVRNIFLWGTAQKDELINRNPDKVLSNKYKIIGAPAFDLSTIKYRQYHNRLRPKELPRSYILVNTNFASHNGYDLKEQLNACKQISDLSLQMIKDSYLREEKQFAVFKEWLEDLIISFPNELFLVRPHPVEILDNYKKLFAKYPNVIISKKGNVNQVIVNAKIVLHKDCTTAMQSYLMGIPVLSLGGSAINSDCEKWPLAFSFIPKTKEQAKAIIQSLLINKVWPKDIKEEIEQNATNVLNSYFNNIGTASQKLVDFIVTDAINLINDQTSYKLIDSRTNIQKVKTFIRKFLPLHYKVPKASKEILLKISKKDLITRLKLFEEVDPLGIKFQVKKIFPNTFTICKAL